MSGQAWKYSDQLDDMDLKMMKRDFFTYVPLSVKAVEASSLGISIYRHDPKKFADYKTGRSGLFKYRS